MIASEHGARTTKELPGMFATETQKVAADRFARSGLAPTRTASDEDTLVIDDRSTLSPAQAVENRLSRILSDTSLPISHLQMRGLLRSR